MIRVSLGLMFSAAAIFALPALCAAQSAGDAPAAPKTPPAASASGATTKPLAIIDVDTTQTPELDDFGKKAQKIAYEWYPKIVAMLPSDGFKPADHIHILFTDKEGVAYTMGNHIVCMKKYFDAHQDDYGAIVHELTHVVQAYGGRIPRANRPPGWLVEGMADWVRWFNYEPVGKRPHPNPNRATYHDSYRTTASFLDFVQNKYDKKLVMKLNAAARTGKYTVDLWKQYTGHTLDELNTQWLDALRAQRKQKQ
jgi:hypothetical protein